MVFSQSSHSWRRINSWFFQSNLDVVSQLSHCCLTIISCLSYSHLKVSLQSSYSHHTLTIHFSALILYRFKYHSHLTISWYSLLSDYDKVIVIFSSPQINFVFKCQTTFNIWYKKLTKTNSQKTSITSTNLLNLFSFTLVTFVSFSTSCFFSPKFPTHGFLPWFQL